LSHLALHRRWIFGLKSRFWLVRDVALGSGHHRLDLSWHLAPDLKAEESSSAVFRSSEDGQGVAIIGPNDSGWNRELMRGFWSPVYGRKAPSLVLNFSTVAQLPVEFVTLIMPLSADVLPAGELYNCKPVGESQLISGYRYQARDEEHSFFLARAGSRWT